MAQRRRRRHKTDWGTVGLVIAATAIGLAVMVAVIVWQSNMGHY